jgi:hypothetical protein
MRRRWVIVAALLALLLAGASFVYLRLPRAPFPFLEGHEPVALNKSLGLVRRSSGPGVRPQNSTTVPYEFRADWDQLARKARLELEAAGFKVIKEDARGLFAFRYRPTEAGVWLHRDLKLVSKRTPHTAAPGWVTVILYGVEAPTSWERIKAIFGL